MPSKPLTKSNNVIPLPPLLWKFLLCLVSLLALCFGVEIFRNAVLNVPRGLYTSFLFYDWFPDLLMHVSRFRHFHSPEFFTFVNANEVMYPAPVAVLYEFFYIAPGGPVAAYIAFTLIGLTIFSGGFIRALLSRGVALAEALPFTIAVLLCAYPLLFMVKQGNMEAVVWVILTAGIAFFLSGRGYSAAACFGAAASMKIYPFVFLGLFLKRGQVTKIVLGVLTCCMIEVASLWLVCPDLAKSWRGINAGLETFRRDYMIPIRAEIGADHSSYAWVKLSQRAWSKRISLTHFDSVGSSHLTAYLATVTLLGVVIFFLRIRYLPITNQVLCLTIASILLPPVSFEYTLVQLFAPLAMLLLLAVDLAKARRALPGMSLALACLALLMAAFPEFVVHGHLHSGQLKTSVLLVLFLVALRWPFSLGQAVQLNSRGDSREEPILATKA